MTSMWLFKFAKCPRLYCNRSAWLTI